MATIITIVAVAAAVVAAAVNGLNNNSKFDSHKSNFKIECDSLVF
jgi:hypothetical protein